MTRYLASVVILSVGLTACGKKAVEPAPEKTAPVKVSVSDVPPPPSAEAPAPPAPNTPATAQEAATPGQPEPVEKPAVTPRRVDQIEGWLHQYAAADANGKADVVKKVRAANLSPAERAFMETTRQRYGYAPMPLN